MSRSTLVVGFVASFTLCAGCETGTPTATDAARADAGRDASPADDAGPVTDAGVIRDAADGAADAAVPACTTVPSDWPGARWPACISDAIAVDGAYVPIGASISTIARVTAFDEMFSPSYMGSPGLLHGLDADPSASAFVDAQLVFLRDQGLSSRVSRRTDDHFSQPAPSASCSQTGFNVCRCLDVAAANPEYCVGPAVLQPIAQEAFAEAAGSATPGRVLAARIEAALLYFLYISPYKESLSCTTTPADCDSSWAYYTGGEPQSSGYGLARYVSAVAPDAHADTWDALLAVRCWRDVDSADTASMLELRDDARDQLDRALDRDLALVLAARLDAFAASSGVAADAHLEFLRTLLSPIAARSVSDGTDTFPVAAREPLFDHAIRDRDTTFATELRATLAATPSAADASAAAARLRELFPCP